MKKFNLQLFADDTAVKKAVDGKQIVYLFRVLGDKDAATAMAFTTENESSMSNEGEVIQTKDGGISMPQIKTEISSTAILAVGDTLADKLKAAMTEGKKVEVWEANLAESIGENTNQFKGRYFQSYLNEFTLTSSSEDHAEYECSFEASDAGVPGNVTVTAAQQEVATYIFTDTTAKTGA